MGASAADPRRRGCRPWPALVGYLDRMLPALAGNPKVLPRGRTHHAAGSLISGASLPMKGIPMTEHVYKMLELTGSSTTSVEDAVQNAIRKAAKTVRKMQWFQVLETRGHIADGAVSHWQVTVKVGFTLDD